MTPLQNTSTNTSSYFLFDLSPLIEYPRGTMDITTPNPRSPDPKPLSNVKPSSSKIDPDAGMQAVSGAQFGTRTTAGTQFPTAEEISNFSSSLGQDAQPQNAFIRKYQDVVSKALDSAAGNID